MSTHLIDCTAMMELPASKKLVLLCLADGADRVTRKVSPGLENVMQWSGLRKSRTLGVIAELVAEGLIVRVTAGQPGQMAEFVVLPGGCCALHGALDVAAVQGAGKVTTRAKADGSAESDPRAAGGGSTVSDPRGSDGGSDNGSDNGSDSGSDSYRTPSVSPVSNVSPPLPTGEGAHAGAHTREAADEPPQLSLVDAPAKPVKGKRGKSAREPQQIGEDWTLSDEMRAKTVERYPLVDVDEEVAAFVNWHMDPNRVGQWSDYDRAWWNWVRKAKPKRSQGSRSGRSGPYRNPVEEPTQESLRAGWESAGTSTGGQW